MTKIYKNIIIQLFGRKLNYFAYNILLTKIWKSSENISLKNLWFQDKKQQIIIKCFRFNTVASQRLVFEEKCEPFLLENTSNLIHEFLYDNFNKKILLRHVKIKHCLVTCPQLRDTRKECNIQSDMNTLLERGCEMETIMKFLKETEMFDEI